MTARTGVRGWLRSWEDVGRLRSELRPHAHGGGISRRYYKRA